MNTNKTRLNCRDRQVYENIIEANKRHYDNVITIMKADYQAEIAEKNAAIEYYRQAAEMAVRSKHRALDAKSERRKDLIAYGVCAVLIVVAVWLAVSACHEFALWAGGH